jgi:hypothetical protein
MSNLELELELLEDMQEAEARQEMFALFSNVGIKVGKNIEKNMHFLMKNDICERIIVTFEDDHGIFF